jgi:hypothetical protein
MTAAGGFPLELIMKSTDSRNEAQTNRRGAAPKKADGRSSAGTTGGAPATEEDIGTEGAGTEPRESAPADAKPARRRNVAR